MTTPPSGTSTEEPPTAGPRVNAEQMRDLGRMRRSSRDRRIAGVAGGIARHFDIDPLLVRIVLVVLVFFGGSGLILYGAGWLLLPGDRGDGAMIALDHRSRNVALWIAAGVAGLSAVGDSLGQWHVPWPVPVVGCVVLVALSRSRARGWMGQPGHPHPPAGQTDPGTSTTTAAETAAGSDRRWPTWQEPDSDPRADERDDDGSADLGDWREGWRTQRDAWVADWQRYRDDWRWRRDPRKRGPVLFGFTLALAALGVGILLTAHLAGANIPPSAYPATVAAACGLMLVVSAFYGRGGGLLLVGLLATAAMVVTSGDGSFEVGRVNEQPSSAAAVHDSYDFGVGELRLDLTDVDDLNRLSGRTIHLDSRIGRILVVVPPSGLDVDAHATVDAAGETELFGRQRDGRYASAAATYDGGRDVPRVTIDADLTFGQIEFTTEETQ